MAKITITPNQADQARFRRTINKLKNSPNEFKRDVQAFAKEAADRARKEAPVATGRLRSSIEVDPTSKGAVITADAPYAGYVEYGTRFRPPHPFFFKNTKGKINKLRQKLNSRLKRITR